MSFYRCRTVMTDSETELPGWPLRSTRKRSPAQAIEHQRAVVDGSHNLAGLLEPATVCVVWLLLHALTTFSCHIQPPARLSCTSAAGTFFLWSDQKTYQLGFHQLVRSGEVTFSTTSAKTEGQASNGRLPGGDQRVGALDVWNAEREGIKKHGKHG